MASSVFPPHDWADEYGILAVSEELSVPLLVEAYRNGIFPWPWDSSGQIPWFSPPRRAVLFLEELRVPRSLRKLIRRNPWRLTINQAFPAVITACANAKRKSGKTWITPSMLAAYTELHHAGFAHSIECWNGTTLVGGVYGVAVGRMFAGESMFFLEPNASKLALCWLLERLRDEEGVPWMDCQQLTPLLQALGAKEIPRDEYLVLLEQEVAGRIRLFGRTES